MTMINTTDYSRALYELAQETGAEDTILEEMKTVCHIFAENPAYVALLDTPAVAKAQRLSLLDESFSTLSPYHLNFLKILCEKQGTRQYPACAGGYEDLYDQAHGILRATAITAVKMSQAQVETLTKKLQTMTGKTVQLQNNVDPEILGGVTLRFGGVQLDGSLQSRLEELRQSLKRAIV